MIKNFEEFTKEVKESFSKLDFEPINWGVEDFDNESEGIIQNVLTDESVKKLFAIKNKREFDDTLHSLVVTRAEKYTIIELIKKNKFNDFEKIRTVESYTGISC